MGALAFEAPLNAIKARLAAGERYFETLIQTYLLDNPHRTTVILKPDPQRQKRLEAAETERLAAERAAMDEAALQQVMDDARQLTLKQETPDSPEVLATIPRLSLDDLEKENKTIPLAVSESNGARVLYHDLFTNGIVYLDIGLNLHALPQEDLPYMGVFGRALLEMGTETQDYVRLSRRIGRETGGIQPATFTGTVMDSGAAAAWGFLRGKATVAHADDLLAIVRDVLLTAQLDNRERFRQLVLEEKASQEAQLIPRGHIVIRDRLQAHFSEADWAAEQMGGVSYLFFLRELAEAVDHDWPAVLARLEAIRRWLMNRNTMLCNVTLDAANWAQFQPSLNDFLAGLPASAPALHTWTPALEPADEGLVIPAQVNYVGKGADLYTSGYRLHGSIVPIVNFLQATWLWERVRVRGGAYGGFATFDRRSGVFTFLSYRDPNVLTTLDNYDQTAQFLRQLDLHEDELVKAIIGAIGIVDAYELPDAKGYSSMTRWLTNDSDEGRQQMRDQILATTVDDFCRFGDVLETLSAHGTVVVLGASDAIDQANAAKGDWLRRQTVL